MNTINVENCKTLSIGRRGENEVTTVAFDFTEWQAEFGSGVVDLYVKRFGDDSAYPVVLTIDGTVASWLVTETDTNVAGYGKAEYVYRVDGKIAKSAVFLTCVMEDIGQPTSTPPDPYESWLEQLTALGAETQANAQAAQTAQANAESFAAAASGAEAAAETAQGKAEDAQDAAEAAQATAESAKAGALAAQGAAETAQGKAEDAQAAAEQAAQDAHVEYEQLSGEVDDLSDEVADQKSAIEDLEALTNRKAGMLVDTASGAIASFVPDSTIPDLLGVSVDIEPVQDLHGYDSPWPAGGGINIFDPDNFEQYQIATAGLRNGHKYTKAGSYSLHAYGTSTTGAYLYGRVKNQDETWGEIAYIVGNLNVINNVIVTIAEGQELYVFDALEHTIEQTKSIFNGWRLQVALSSTQPAEFRPYSNECPISGWDSVEVEATGINVWDEEWEAGGISDTTGEKIPQSSRIRSKNYIPCVPNTSYCLVSPLTSNDVRIAYYRADFSFISMTPWTVNGAFTTNASAHYMMFFTAGAYGNTYHNDISINYPATAHAYRPYAGNRYTIQLGQTVYGGTLDVTAGTMTVDRAAVTLDGSVDEAWTAEAIDTVRQYFRLPVGALGSVVANDVLSNIYTQAVISSSTAVVGINVVNSAGYNVAQISVRPMNASELTVADFRAQLTANPLQVVYRLATPVTIDLDPVTIATIANQPNNVWADAGDVSVTYAADIKAYIDRLNQPTEDDMIANTLIQSGKYFTINNRLFLSTASIAAGAQIIPGTNCTETSLAAALNALNA